MFLLADLSEFPVETAKFIRDQKTEVVQHELTLDYEYFTAGLSLSTHCLNTFC